MSARFAFAAMMLEHGAVVGRAVVGLPGLAIDDELGTSRGLLERTRKKPRATGVCTGGIRTGQRQFATASAYSRPPRKTEERAWQKPAAPCQMP